eukprot:13308006-Alexandrium_andersonii.AAC.1
MPEKSVMMAMVGFVCSVSGSSACEAGSSSVGAASGTPTDSWLLAISMGSPLLGKPAATAEGRAAP